MILAAILLLSVLTAAQDTPAHCRHPDDLPSSDREHLFYEAVAHCEEAGVTGMCESSTCLLQYLDTLDEDGTVKPKEMAEILFGEGYEESKEYFAGLISLCIEHGAERMRACGVIAPVDCAVDIYTEECLW